MDDLAGRLAEWAADARLADAVAERTRLRWMAQQAVEGATLAGVVRDLAQRQADAAVTLANGAAKSGRITAVGADFLALDGSTLIPLHAVAAIRSTPVAGDEARDNDPDRQPLALAALLSRLSGDRPDVRVETTAPGTAITGALTASGADVVVLRPAAYVPLAAIAAIALL